MVVTSAAEMTVCCGRSSTQNKARVEYRIKRTDNILALKQGCATSTA